MPPMRKSRHTGAGAGAGCRVCNLPAALTPDDPKGPLTPCLRLHPLSGRHGADLSAASVTGKKMSQVTFHPCSCRRQGRT